MTSCRERGQRPFCYVQLTSISVGRGTMYGRWETPWTHHIRCECSRTQQKGIIAEARWGLSCNLKPLSDFLVFLVDVSTLCMHNVHNVYKVVSIWEHISQNFVLKSFWLCFSLKKSWTRAGEMAQWLGALAAFAENISQHHLGRLTSACNFRPWLLKTLIWPLQVLYACMCVCVCVCVRARAYTHII